MLRVIFRPSQFHMIIPHLNQINFNTKGSKKKFLQIFVLGPPGRDALKIGKLVGQKLFYSNFMPHF